MTLGSSQTIAKLLPFWGAQRVISYAVGVSTSTGIAPLVAILYPSLLLAVAAYIAHVRAPVVRPITR